MSQTQAQPRLMVTLENGSQVQALTPERLEQIVNGMIAKGKILTMADDKRYIKGLAIQGNGNAYEGAIGLRFIYNVDLLSQVAMTAPKAVAALEAIHQSLADGADLLSIHNACRAYLNAVTVSFSVATQAFNAGELVQASVRTVTTENGSLITLEKVTAQAAEVLKARPELKMSFGFKRNAVELPTGKKEEGNIDIAAAIGANKVVS